MPDGKLAYQMVYGKLFLFGDSRIAGKLIVFRLSAAGIIL